jgi:hypothetical protein
MSKAPRSHGEAPLDRSKLSPLARRVLDARDVVLASIEHLDAPEAMMALQYAVASWGTHVVANTTHTEQDVAGAFAEAVLSTMLDPAWLTVPVRRQ